MVAATYQQIGSDIDGEAPKDEFGSSVSMSADGTTFVVGAKRNNGVNGTNSGHVRVYKFDSNINTYAQVGLDIDGEAAFDFFGSSVSMSADGTTFVVGAGSNNGINGTHSGHVRVYKFDSTDNMYAQVGLDIDGEAARDHFGRSVSMSGDGTTFVVGARFNDGIDGRDSGHVRVYKFDAIINSYTQVGLDIDGEVSNDLFGWSVSISGDGTTFVVGAIGRVNASGSYFPSTEVRVYKFNSTMNMYAQVGLNINGKVGRVNDGFGRSVSMSADGTTFVVGAPYGIPYEDGYVRVYKFDSTLNSYVQVGSEIESERGGDFFGWSVSMSADGTTFVVGNIYNGYEYTPGTVHVYKFDSIINSYTQVGLDIDGEADYDQFGYSVSMSGDGTTFVVGAFSNDGLCIDSGYVRVYSNKRPNMVPTKSPTKPPTTVNCKVSWKLFNSQTDSLVANLSNGTTVSKAPPCTRTNIEALVPCGDSNKQVLLELYNDTALVQRRMERVVPYFLFGNNDRNIYNGRIAPGKYRIRAKVNGMFTPFTTFTLQGPVCR